MGLTMRVAIAGSLLGALGLVEASPYYPNTTHTVYTTEVVTSLTTYCPMPTTLTIDQKTYTITEATTLTITDCPCTVTKPVVHPTTTSSAHKDECAEACYTAYNKCRGKPGANMATCASEYASCLGYNPFSGNGTLITPTACSSRIPSATTGSAVYTTEVVTSLTTYCPAPTTLTFNEKTYTITEATTLTITDCPCTISKSVPVKPVYTTEVVTALTTYCPEPTTLSFNNKTYTVTEPTTFTITDCPCTISKPAQPTTTSVYNPDCAEKCTDAYNKCRGQPGANMATCAAEYASCLGYNPFGDDGSLITPTACSFSKPVASAGRTSSSSKVAVPTTSVPVQPATSTVSVTTQPVATQPVATKPATTSPVVVEAAAGRISPANILLALGAIALM